MRHPVLKNSIAYFIVAVAGLCLFASCEKEVHIHLNNVPSALVVEGQIETGQPPFVLLTSSLGFFSNIDLGTLQNSFVHGATVKVADGADTVTLKEYSIDTAGGNKFYFYTLDTTHLARTMFGQVEHFYTLIIQSNGQTYTALTKIPNPTPVDTMWVDSTISGSKKIPSDALQLFVTYTDPDTPGNCVRYFTSRNNEPYWGVSVFTDQLINGQVVSKIGLYAGYDDSTNANGDSLSYFYPGDTVSLEWCTIDKGVYNFWYSLAYAQQAAGNPFASPINAQTNISNGALGVWSGYGSSYRTLIIPK